MYGGVCDKCHHILLAVIRSMTTFVTDIAVATHHHQIMTCLNVCGQKRITLDQKVKTLTSAVFAFPRRLIRRRCRTRRWRSRFLSCRLRRVPVLGTSRWKGLPIAGLRRSGGKTVPFRVLGRLLRFLRWFKVKELRSRRILDRLRLPTPESKSEI